jgi:hypothetical protein
MNFIMLANRSGLISADSRPLTSTLVETVCSEVIASSHFLVARSLNLHGSRQREEPFWELFLGRALDHSQTREKNQFESWWISVEGDDSAEPLLALRWDQVGEVIHVTRAIACRIREGYESGEGIFETREATRWVRELAGTVDLMSCRTAGRLRDELSGLLLQAVVGTSRLPLTSLESPLPAFTLGQLAYCFRSSKPPAESRCDVIHWTEQLADPSLSSFERAKIIESTLRSSHDADLESVRDCLLRIDPRIDWWLEQIFQVFNGVSLSPYTNFVPRVLWLARELTVNHPARRADFLSRLVLLIDRHLCAYDLVKFHHRGANYPDALLLDELWRQLLELLNEHPGLFEEMDDGAVRQRRRAVRHAFLLRLEYAGHRVPDWPTSIGENARVMPAPFHPLPDEQIHAPQRRTRKLFDQGMDADVAVTNTLIDLDDPRELRELGSAFFLDRPFGAAKQPGEPDRTPLLSHILFSRSVAERRLSVLARHTKVSTNEWLAALASIDTGGMPLAEAGPSPRPGVVSLHDALLSADDWIARRTTRSSLSDLEMAFEWPATGNCRPKEWRLLLPSGADLIAFDGELRPVCRLSADYSRGYMCRGGVEVPASGLVISPESGPELTVAPALGE